MSCFVFFVKKVVQGNLFDESVQNAVNYVYKTRVAYEENYFCLYEWDVS